MEPHPLSIPLAVLALVAMLFVLAGVGLYLTIRDTVGRRGGWGVNVAGRLSALRCTSAQDPPAALVSPGDVGRLHLLRLRLCGGQVRS